MAIILPAGKILKHTCGLEYKNLRKEPVSFPNDKCPQCGGPLTQSNVSAVSNETTTLILVPPHGTSFKNTMGSEVQITMPRGFEMDLFHEMERQLHSWVSQFVQNQPRSGPDEFDKARLLSAGRTALTKKKIALDDDGNIVFSDGEGDTSGQAT